MTYGKISDHQSNDLIVVTTADVFHRKDNQIGESLFCSFVSMNDVTLTQEMAAKRQMMGKTINFSPWLSWGSQQCSEGQVTLWNGKRRPLIFNHTTTYQLLQNPVWNREIVDHFPEPYTFSRKITETETPPGIEKRPTNIFFLNCNFKSRRHIYWFPAVPDSIGKRSSTVKKFQHENH